MRFPQAMRGRRLLVAFIVEEDIGEPEGVCRIEVRQFLHRNNKRIFQLLVSGSATTNRELRIVTYFPQFRRACTQMSPARENVIQEDTGTLLRRPLRH